MTAAGASSGRTRGLLSLPVLLLLALPVVAGAPRSVAWTARTMGTYVRVTLATDDSAGASREAQRALAVFQRVDSLMSNWTVTSEVARINREASAAATRVHPEVGAVLAAALRLWHESGGAYDITVEPLVRAWGFLGGPRRVPSEGEIRAALARVGAERVHYDPATRLLAFDDPRVRIDLGGIAKGYAVDVAAESLKAHGVTDALVDLSGNMVALGSSGGAGGAGGWRIGIRDPRDRVPYVARLSITAQAISTSGQYERFLARDGRTYGHILNPRTGWPAEGLISVTVVSSSAMECDGWDTPLFVMGPLAAKRTARALDHVAAVLIQPGDGRVDTMWVEETLRDRLLLEPAAQAFIRVRYF
ncbi:MAG: FAD:protein FMN transferase [Candidatus Eiseniibacteriota bacterium]